MRSSAFFPKVGESLAARGALRLTMMLQIVVTQIVQEVSLLFYRHTSAMKG